ncbi:MAG: DoxX family protein [Verrucomicrobia bacterium]|nr:DoxX family protein [Verrucomicrobiota bacterium]
MNLANLFKPLRLSARVSAGLLILRLVVGLAFVFHGYGKIQNPLGWMGPDANVPGFFQLLAAISEFGGGLAWMLGLLTPLASFGIACTMTVAVSLHAFVLHDPFVAKGPGSGSYEPASVYFCLAVFFLLAGPGRFSLDRVIFSEKASGAPSPDPSPETNETMKTTNPQPRRTHAVR